MIRRNEKVNIKRVIRAVEYRIVRLIAPICTHISPMLNTCLWYRYIFGRRLNFGNPQTLNEKILWLKFNNYRGNPLVKQCADKYLVRDYIKKVGCEEILNELICIYESVAEIEWEKLPQSFVMKLNVGCGCNIIVPDKDKININDAKTKLRKWMKEKYYLRYSEMQYKDVKPVILVEKYLKPKAGGVLPEDYKFYCINGRAEYVMVCVGREENGHPRFYFFDRNWNFVPFEEQNDPGFQKPMMIEKAFEYADALAKPFPCVRTDLYLFDNLVIFGELTFTSAGGFDADITEEAQMTMGRMIDLGYNSSRV